MTREDGNYREIWILQLEIRDLSVMSISNKLCKLKTSDVWGKFNVSTRHEVVKINQDRII